MNAALPPKGRGGIIHRHIQHLVSEEARAKGYATRLEYQLPTGAIVDVHLEKGQEKRAIEVAIVSTPERELAHISACLSFGYDRVVVVMQDPNLLQRTTEALEHVLSDAERARVQLVPLKRLAGSLWP